MKQSQANNGSTFQLTAQALIEKGILSQQRGDGVQSREYYTQAQEVIHRAQDGFIGHESPDETSGLVKVLVARTDIKPYIPLTEELVEFQERPAEQVPIGATQTVAQYEHRALRQAAVKGEVILTSKLGERGDYNASTEIPDGYRMLTVPIAATTSHRGQIRPHDRVDIFCTYKSKDSAVSNTPNMLTKLILDYIEVFSIGTYSRSELTADDQTLTKNASLLVTQQQAQILLMAQSKGDLSLALRPKNDDAVVELDPLSEEDFDMLGTNFSMREDRTEQHQKELDELRDELTNKYKQQLADLDQKTADTISQSLTEIEQQYSKALKRRDELHAKTLASLEAKNSELQSSLTRALANTANKEELLKQLREAQSRNSQLSKLLFEAQTRSADPTIPAVGIKPSKWKIRIQNGRQNSVSEFEIDRKQSASEPHGDGTQYPPPPPLPR